MPEFTFDQLEKWSRGTWDFPSRGKACDLPRNTGGNFCVRGVTQDTRNLSPGGLFVAIRDQRDGHDYIPDAQKTGAAAALVASDFTCHDGVTIPLLRVADTRKALQDLARGWREACRETFFIGVTGSAGKTTTRCFVQTLLATLGKTHGTSGNLNNDLGLPLSLLAMPGDAKFGVFEIGMNHPGELLPLCEILQPHAGIVTNVGPVHLEFFNSVHDIAVEKATLLRAIPEDGFAVLDDASPFFDYLKSQLRGELLVASDAACHNLVSPFAGCHNALNLRLAATLANRLDVAWETMNAALENMELPEMRGQSLRLRGRWIINDAYNANPMSMRCAIDTFAQQTADWQGRRVVVLGDMRELGEASETLHREIGAHLAQSKLKTDLLVVVGNFATRIADAFRGENPGVEILRFPDAKSAAAEVSNWSRENDAVLLKASRGVGLERVVEALARGCAPGC